LALHRILAKMLWFAATID